MNMKMLFGFLFVLALVPLASAAPAWVEADIKETAVMENHFGAQVRLIQLDRAIERNIIIGEETITAIEADSELNASVNITTLEAILLEMEELQDEVQAEMESDFNNQTVEAYIDFKAQARALTEGFRTEVAGELSAEMRAEIRAQAQERIRTYFEATREEFHELRQEYMAHVATRVMGRYGVGNGLAAEIRAGSHGPQQARAMVEQRINMADPEVRAEVRAEHQAQMQERRIRANVQHDHLVDVASDARAEAHERIRTRIGALNIRGGLGLTGGSSGGSSASTSANGSVQTNGVQANVNVEGVLG